MELRGDRVNRTQGLMSIGSEEEGTIGRGLSMRTG